MSNSTNINDLPIAQENVQMSINETHHPQPQVQQLPQPLHQVPYPQQQLLLHQHPLHLQPQLQPSCNLQCLQF